MASHLDDLHIETKPPPSADCGEPITRWSRSGMRRTFDAASSSFVSSTSLRLGVGSPLGWLWATTIAAACHWTACAKTSLAPAGVPFRSPLDTQIASLIGLCAASSGNTKKCSRSSPSRILARNHFAASALVSITCGSSPSCGFS